MEINLVLLAPYVSLARDVVVTLAAVITALIAIYGLRVWKRDLVGKESYEAAKTLVYQSHVAARESYRVRLPIRESERVVFTKEESENMTEGERWRISEATAFRNRLKVYDENCAGYFEALLRFRVIAGSKVFRAFSAFQEALDRPVYDINLYLGLLDDFSVSLTVESDDVVLLRGYVQAIDKESTDRLLSVGDAREQGELFLLSYLHRKSIYN